MTYRFALLDPRPTDAARAANDAVFAAGSPVYGIEVTVPALAARCATNIDPQHWPFTSTPEADVAAIDVCLNCEIPPDGATLVTVRPDLDSIGAMAVFELRRSGRLTLDPVICADGWGDDGYMRHLDGRDAGALMRRLDAVSAADRFARGPWPGPRPLPSVEDRWPSAQAGASDTHELAAIASLVSDPAHSVEARVLAMSDWLRTGDCSYLPLLPYEDRVERERDEMILALENGTIGVFQKKTHRFVEHDCGAVELVSWPSTRISHKHGCPGRGPDDWCNGWTSTELPCAVVRSSHRAATMLGYCVAPVVVAENPRFRLGSGPEHRKITICAWDASHCDIRAALAELAALEPGWGGSSTIGGSPQGVSTDLSLLRIVAVVSRHVKAA
jgi:hypothetical protein